MILLIDDVVMDPMCEDANYIQIDIVINPISLINMRFVAVLIAVAACVIDNVFSSKNEPSSFHPLPHALYLLDFICMDFHCM